MYCFVLGIYAKVGIMYFHCQQLITTPCAFDVLDILECQLPPTSVNNFLYCCDEVSLQCVFFSVCNKSYLCELPNRLKKTSSHLAMQQPNSLEGHACSVNIHLKGH